MERNYKKLSDSEKTEKLPRLKEGENQEILTNE
jgi:hypothetical protein